MGVATETGARGREKDTIYPPRTDLAKPSAQGKTPYPLYPCIHYSGREFPLGDPYGFFFWRNVPWL